ncbi:MAG: MBL fold metallo-hydrolase, partial [Planctomycetota bacterium]|nr:MBL fold metallo-hydrolase [Planctomycetota bacterium]
VIALPMVALLLALGFVKIVLTLLLPSLALLLGVPLSVIAKTLIALVDAIDGLPGSAVHVPYPSLVWTIAGLTWVLLLALVENRRWRWLIKGMLPGLILWLIAPMTPWFSNVALRLDMLAVGDGTCIVVRSQGSTALFDAGSSTDLNAGQRIIVPALRRLNVRTIDFIAISHANLDHYSAVLEIVDEFEVQKVLVTPHLIETARLDHESPIAHLLDQLTQRYVMVSPTSAGDRMTLGDATLTWLHPDEDDRFTMANDSSMVIRIDAGGRSALLCGDLQQRGIIDLLTGQEFVKVDILELPHHGSYSVEAVEFLRLADPEIVLQSTGLRRWEADRWRDELAQRQRLVTARDGACGVIIDREGRIETWRYITPSAAAPSR